MASGPAPPRASAADRRRRGMRHSAACTGVGGAARSGCVPCGRQLPRCRVSTPDPPACYRAPCLPPAPRHPAGRRAPAHPPPAAPVPRGSRPAAQESRSTRGGAAGPGQQGRAVPAVCTTPLQGSATSGDRRQRRSRTGEHLCAHTHIRQQHPPGHRRLQSGPQSLGMCQCTAQTCPRSGRWGWRSRRAGEAGRQRDGQRGSVDTRRAAARRSMRPRSTPQSAPRSQRCRGSGHGRRRTAHAAAPAAWPACAPPPRLHGRWVQAGGAGVGKAAQVAEHPADRSARAPTAPAHTGRSASARKDKHQRRACGPVPRRRRHFAGGPAAPALATRCTAPCLPLAGGGGRARSPPPPVCTLDSQSPAQRTLSRMRAAHTVSNMAAECPGELRSAAGQEQAQSRE